MFDLALEEELAPYVKNFNMHDLPFTSSIPDNNFYLNADLEQHINHLIHLLQSSDLVLVLAGEDGSGKTTLIQQLINRQTPGLDFCMIQASEQLEPAALLTQLTRCFELPEQLDNKTTFDLLKDHANILRTNNRIPVAIIDDAHELPADTLKLLLSLQQENKDASPDHWHVILVTHSAYTADLLQLNERLHFIHINALTPEQTADYINHRLYIAGLESNSPLPDKDIDFIYQQSEGLPKRIHQLAHQILMQKTPAATASVQVKETPLPQTSGKKHKGLIIVSTLLALLLGSVLFFQDDINRLIESQPDRKTVSQQQSFPLPIMKSEKKNRYLLHKIPDPEPAKPVTAQKQQVVINNQTNPVVKKPTNIKKTVLTTSAQARQKTDTTEKITTKPVTPSAVKLSPFETKLKKHAIRTYKWIMQQNQQHFTAQIMASSRADSLIKQATLPALAGKTAIYAIKRNGAPWYVLLYGQKTDKLAMKAAIAGLPGHLQKNRPWIRSFAAIQAEIRSGKK